MKGALLALMLAAPAAAQPQLAPGQPAPKPALGETFELSFALQSSGNYELRPDTSALEGSDFGFISSSRDGAKYTIKAQAFGLGVSTFPALSWAGGGAEARSPEVPLEIRPAFKDTQKQDIRDIYPPFRYTPWLWVLAGLLAAAAAAWAYLRYRARRDALAWLNWKDSRSPYQRADERLRKLAASPLASSPRAKDFYTGLTSILRLYLAEEFRIEAAQMTTADLARDLKRTGADIKTILAARAFLDKADLVKFARLAPGERAADAASLGSLLQSLAAAAAASRPASTHSQGI